MASMATPADETALREAAGELRRLMERLSMEFRHAELVADAAICASIGSAVARFDATDVPRGVIRIRRAARAVGDVMKRTGIGDIDELRRVLRAYMLATDPFLGDTAPIVLDDE